jgi:hypothetical protein
MIDLSHLTEADLFGRFLLKVPGGDKFTGYYCSLDALRPLLYSESWLDSVSGFYINVAGGFDTVRLSYFAPSADLPRTAIGNFASQCQLEVEILESPHYVRIARKYGGEELRFRRFLSTYTPVGLEIMEADLLHARCLFATFRWQVMRARESYRPHFLRTFESQSAFYNSLAREEQDQFWRDLAHWPNPPQVDWAHMFVNMVLACDWIRPQDWRGFQRAQPPLPIPKINKKVAPLDFQIPDEWRP